MFIIIMSEKSVSFVFIAYVTVNHSKRIGQVAHDGLRYLLALKTVIIDRKMEVYGLICEHSENHSKNTSLTH